jgi:4-hydroxy-tetrahydrodipicolinate synthase
MPDNTLAGIIAYTVTPFSNNNEKINLEALYQLIDELIDSGASAIAALGSAGEGVYLDNDEWATVAQKTISHVSGRLPVIIGISELTTKKAVSRAVFANEIGAAIIMVSPFSYYSLSEDEIFDHYAAISAAISIPIMVYNNPATCGVDMSPEFMLSMVDKIENVTMIKESSGDIKRMRSLQRLSNGNVSFFNGCNYLALGALKAGAQGWCTAAPCLIADLPKRVVEEFNKGNLDEAQRLFEQQLPLLEFIVAGGLASTVKAGLEINGLSVGHARRPLKPLMDDRIQILKGMMKTVGMKGGKKRG